MTDTGKNPVTGFAASIRRRMWIADDRGLTVFDGERLRNHNNTEGIIEKSGRALAEDIERQYWIGYQSGWRKKVT
jgi:ligand-binding sensor domain-containing protein